MALFGLYPIKNGTSKDRVKSNIYDCKNDIKDCQSDIRFAQRLIDKKLKQIKLLEVKILELNNLTIINGKVVK